MEEDIHDLDKLFFKKLNGSLSAAEQAYLEEQLRRSPQNMAAFDESLKVWQHSAKLHPKQGLTQEDRWNLLQQKTSRRTSLIPSRRTFMRYAATLTIIGLIVGIYFYSNAPEVIEVKTQLGETKLLTLPDRSSVVLNSETTLTYDKASWEDERKINLDGEAFFKVEKKNIPFIVYANGTVTRVLGTTFNVRSREAKTVVTCLTGKVSFGKDSETRLLTKSTGATITGDILSSVYPIAADTTVLWMTNGLSFNNTPLKEVFAELERHFNASILIERDLGTLTFTGRFRKPTLKNVIETVCLSAGLEYKINNKEVVIK